MPQQDVFHEVVKNALIKDGWRITHDPYPLQFGEHNLYVDLGAEAPIAAEKGERKIAVEIKSFVGRSAMTDLKRSRTVCFLSLPDAIRGTGSSFVPGRLSRGARRRV